MYSADGKYSHCDIRTDLMSPTVGYVENVLAVDNDVAQKSQQLLRLNELLRDFCDATLKSVVDNFGNFGRTTWGPLLSKICVEVGVSKFKEIQLKFERAGESIQLIKSLEFYENAFLVFNEVNPLLYRLPLVILRGG